MAELYIEFNLNRGDSTHTHKHKPHKIKLGSVGSLRKLAGLYFGQHHKAIQRVTCADDQILIPIQFMRDRAIADSAAQIGVPQRIACAGIKRNKVICTIAREHQMARCG